MTTNRNREFTGIARYDLAPASWTWLITDDAHDLAGWVSPDGAWILVERNEDGASVLTLHDAATGAAVRDVPLPAGGCVTDVPLPDPRWSPDSRAVVMSVAAADCRATCCSRSGHGRVRVLTGSPRSLAGFAAARPEAHQVPTPGRRARAVPGLPERAARRPGASRVGGAGHSRRPGEPGEAQLQPRRAGAGRRRAHRARAERPRLGRLRQALVLGRRRQPAARLGGRLAAIHGYLPKLGIDPARAALYGGSYGGYMVLAGLAFQPELWAAGVDIVGISSLVTFLENTSAYRRAQREREYGSLAGRPRLPGRSLPADQDRRDPRAAVHHPRRERPEGPAQRGRAAARGADRAGARNASCSSTPTRAMASPNGPTSSTPTRARSPSWPGTSRPDWPLNEPGPP